MTTKNILRAASVLLLLSVFSATPVDGKKKSYKTPKYVFYLIGDGMGINEAVGTQYFNNATGIGGQLNFLNFPVRTFVTTYSANSLVTDSAAAGTALATGVKTNNDALGVDAQGKPVSNLTEWAHAKGFGTGVATTVGVNHATPGAFYAHTSTRNNYEDIANQLVAADFVNFAGGGGFNNEKRKTGNDSRYLEGLFAPAGITVLHGRDEFKNISSVKGRVLCLDANNNSEEYKLSINQRNGEERLADLTQAGVDYLYSNFAKQGFFFMIEGGLIDHAGHSDDGVSDFYEVNDFAAAIDVCLDFYNKHPKETLIVITADHETGALMLGTGKYELSPELVAFQKEDEDALNAKFRELKSPTWDQVKAFLTENLGLWTNIKVPQAQEDRFIQMYQASLKNNDQRVVSLYSSSTRIVSEAIDFVNKQAGFSWAHGSHTGSPVGLYVKGDAAAEFISCKDNTDIPKMIKAVAGY